MAPFDEQSFGGLEKKKKKNEEGPLSAKMSFLIFSFIS
jgi:hypothetical protein